MFACVRNFYPTVVVYACGIRVVQRIVCIGRYVISLLRSRHTNDIIQKVKAECVKLFQ